ncbi:TadE/TadG family type IV pilus assembly protein [candidate division CSSED10-310 bacterium]|uniref:TadE/TadG family type IV pilus assembly protein n=1 Tax=candidate division CSSED10-310 bacterium TaxID=2855610 RepID=A0ABV6Z0H4_UNCC1
MTRGSPIFRNQAGQAMTEFVIVLPPLLIMFFSVLYFGKAVIYKEKVNMAARYVSFREARDPGSADGLYQKFFEGAGPNNVSHYTTDDWGPQAAGLGWAAAFLIEEDYVMSGHIASQSTPGLQRVPAKKAHVSYHFSPPGWVSWIGNKTTYASLGVDADPWKISSTTAFFLKGAYCIQYQWDFAIYKHREDTWWGDDELW